jgi:tetratricopeptide (TPR) repeat protein
MAWSRSLSSPREEPAALLRPWTHERLARCPRSTASTVRRAPLAQRSLFSLAMLCAFPLAGHAREPSTCAGPARLDQSTAAHPSPGSYQELGNWFLTRRQFSCAISAFESALRLDPGLWQSHYDLGVALLSSGNPRQAVLELQAASGLKAGSAQILLALGSALSQLDRQDEAIDAFRAVLKADPQSVKALDGLTQALIAAKRYTAAIADLRNAPADEVLQLNLADAYLKNGNADEALKTVSAIVQEHPSSFQAHSNLGVVYSQQSRFAEAAQEFREALRLNPSDDFTCIAYVKALVVLAQFDTAAPVIRDCLRRRPRDFDALYLTGVVDRELGNNADAEKVLRRAVAIDPNHFDTRYSLGLVLTRLSRPAEALPQLQAAVKLDPDSSKAHFQLAAVLRQLGQADQAGQELTVLHQKMNARVNQDVAGAKANQANREMQAGNPRRAVDLYRESLVGDPGNARTYYDLALALDRTGDDAGERQALEKALQLDPQLAPVHNQLGLLHLQARQNSQAEEQFKAAIALDPQYAEAQNNLGVLYGQLSRDADAERLFRQATENNPQYGQAFANLGLILAGESRDTEAAQALESALRLNANNTGALSAYAMLLERQNRGSEALPLLRKVTALDPKSPGAHVNLGTALQDRFDLNGALAEFSEAIRLDRNNAVAHYFKGRVLLDLRRNGDARAELEEAERLDPGATDSRYLLGVISMQAEATDESIRHFEMALAARPDNADAWFLLGQQLMRKGDGPGAIERWRKTIAISPQYNKAYDSLAQALTKTDPQEASNLQSRLQDLLARQHLVNRVQLLDSFALASSDAHDWPQAIAQLGQAIEECGQCGELPRLHKDLGLIDCRTGDLSHGRMELLAAQKLSPGDPAIEDALRMLELLMQPQ